MKQPEFPGHKNSSQTIIAFSISDYTVAKVIGVINSVHYSQLFFPGSPVKIYADLEKVPCKVKRKLSAVGAALIQRNPNCLKNSPNLWSFCFLSEGVRGDSEYIIMHDVTRSMTWQTKDSLEAWLHSSFTWHLMIDVVESANGRSPAATYKLYSVSAKVSQLCYTDSHDLLNIRDAGVDTLALIRNINKRAQSEGCLNVTVLCSTTRGVNVPGCDFITTLP